MKRIWTEADFDRLSWHDNSVHALSIVRGGDGAGELILDLDHILDWIEAEGAYHCRVAPAELRFHNVTDLRMTLDYSTLTAAFTPFTLDGIRSDEAATDRFGRWVLKINWPVGEISFASSGFTQRLAGEPLVSAKQSLERSPGTRYIAIRELAASHPERGDFALRVCIGEPYYLGQNEWECAVALDGLYSNLRGPHGGDAFQSLMLAQNLARSLLLEFVDRGGRLLDAPNGSAVDVHTLFGSGV